MNLNSQSKPNKVGLLIVTLSACLLATGCGGKKKRAEPAVLATPVVLSQQLASPSLSYLSTDLLETGSSIVTFEQWMVIANNNYKSKNYARALRAATEAFNLNNESIEARELAMLSALRVTQNNIDDYRNNALMNDSDRTELRDTFADITSLINTP